MLFSPRYLAASFVLVGILSGCSAGGATSALHSTAPSPAGRPTATVGGAEGSRDGRGLGGKVAPGGDMCGLLGPGDFAAVGVRDAGSAVNHSDNPAQANCDYSVVASTASPIEGGATATPYRELDVFIGSPEASYQLILQNEGIASSDATADLPGVDAAGTQLDVGGLRSQAAIGVRKGQLTFDIILDTTSTNARAQLIALAKLVLERESGLSS